MTEKSVRDDYVPIRALIIEDEPHMRRYLTELLDDQDEVTIVGEASDGAEGLAKIRELSPDLVFLDVQMPEMNGFDVISQVGPENKTAFIFVTAFSEYASRAFEVDAVDYLCKPFDRDRLQDSLERAVRHLRFRSESNAPVKLSNPPPAEWISRISTIGKEGTVFVPIEKIRWIEATDKYVIVHATDGNYIGRHTLERLESQLDPKQFVRIHRSTLVRKAAVRTLCPLFHGDYTLKLDDHTELKLSRRFRESFLAQMSR
jgi:two-component system LytT family response regulator